MPTLTNLLTFALVALGMVLTPGPNMIYLISRSICQGRNAGLVSLAGIATGFVFYMLCAAFGITALLMAVPFAYDALRFGGAIYLLYLAWQAVRPGGRTPFQVRELPVDSPRKLYTMGLLTSMLNPKVAVFYLSLFPQFIEPGAGNVLLQSLVLGIVHIAISATFDALLVTIAGALAAWFATRPLWLRLQRWVLGGAFGVLAVWLALTPRHAP